MQIPLAITFFLYLAFLIFIGIFSFFNIYHLLRFAPRNPKTYAVIILYLAVTVMIVTITLTLLTLADWSQELEFSPSLNNLYLNRTIEFLPSPTSPNTHNSTGHPAL